MRGKIIGSMALVVIGVGIVLIVPTAHEGPMLLYINEQHAICLVDALGLAVAIPAWFYLNWFVLQLWVGRRKSSNT
jgi:hypothetical protein